MNEEQREEIRLNHDKFKEALERQETGAIELSLWLQWMDKSKDIGMTVLSMFASAHGKSLVEYKAELYAYALDRGIMERVKP